MLVDIAVVAHSSSSVQKAIDCSSFARLSLNGHAAQYDISLATLGPCRSLPQLSVWVARLVFNGLRSV